MRKVFLALSIFLLISLAFVSIFRVHALGGGFIQSGSTNNNAGSSTCIVTLNNVIQNDYLVTASWAADKVGGVSNTVSTVTDGGDTFVKGKSQQSGGFTLEIWAGQFVQATGSVTVTITFSASTGNKCILQHVSGLTSTTADATSQGSGSVSANNFAASVSSFTPTIHDYCLAAVGDSVTAGTQTARSDSVGNPFLLDKVVGTNGNGKQLASIYRTDMDGTAQTAADTVTLTGATAINWNEIAACYLGGQATTTVTTTTTSTSTRLVGDEPNFLWLWAIPIMFIIVILLAVKRRR